MNDALLLNIIMNPTMSGSKEGALLKSIISGKPISAALGTGGVKGTVQREFGESGMLKQISAQEKAAASMSAKIAKDEEKLAKKHDKENKGLTYKTIGILAGIGYTLTQVPSILRGSLKMLSFGFLLILKPLADLLATIVLPIAANLLKIALWMNNVAGSGIGGMITMAVVGLLAAIAMGIGALMVGGLATSLISAAIGKYIVGAIGATAVEGVATAGILTKIGTLIKGVIASTVVEGLAAGLITGLVAKYIADSFGITDTASTAVGIATALGTLIAVSLGLLTLPEAGILSIMGIVALKLEQALNKIVFDFTGFDFNKSMMARMEANLRENSPWLGGLMFGAETNTASPAAMTSPQAASNPNTSTQPVISISNQSGLIDENKLRLFVREIVKQSNQTNNTRQGMY